MPKEEDDVLYYVHNQAAPATFSTAAKEVP
jgi:hypothetical protein